MLRSNPTEPKYQNQVFQLFFLIDSENQDIGVVGVDGIDFTKGKRRLEEEEPVFIVRERKRRVEPIMVAGEETVKPRHFTHP